MDEKIIKPIIVILGPTASGKTALAVNLAKKISAEIISADSRQVYTGMDIGTGKDLHLFANVPHHLIDICEAGESYNLSRFQIDFKNAVTEIANKNKNIILCGGTGLYLQAVIQNFDNQLIPPDEALRKELENIDTETLLRMLQPSKEKKEINSRKRIIRAIEKQRFLEKNPNNIIEKKRKDFEFTVFGLNPNTEQRRENISQRLAERLAHGLIDEVKNLHAGGVSHEKLQYYGLEYKYVSKYILGEISALEMQNKLETEIHRFAKRQMTFFRSMETKGIKINWLPADLSLEAKIKYITDKI